MTAKRGKSYPTSHDPDDAPAWSDAQLARAELAEGEKVLKPAAGTLKRGKGRPKVERPKQQVSVRLDADVLTELRKDGARWQSRINAILRKAVGCKAGRKPRKRVLPPDFLVARV